jgi:hypothetical protein
LSESSRPDQPTTAASIEAPGFIVPRDGGNISIYAMYNGWRFSAFYWFAVAPGHDAIVLARALRGAVLESDGRGPVLGAKVEILDGPYAGETRNTTNAGYSFDFFPVGVPFTIQASKAGYETVTKGHPGIAYSPFVAPQSLFNIVLPRTQ